MFYKKLGENIKTYRTLQHMSMQELGDAIYKSKAAIFKYEKGLTSIDIETLLQIAKALNVSYIQLLTVDSIETEQTEEDKALIDVLNEGYFYQYNGPSRGLIRGRIFVHSKDNITLFYDYDIHEDYKDSNMIYWGHGNINGHIVSLFLRNQRHNIECCTCSARIPIIPDDYIFGFITGLSPSTLTPIINKFIISKKSLAFDDQLLKALTFNKDELLAMKKNNTLELSVQLNSLYSKDEK